MSAFSPYRSALLRLMCLLFSTFLLGTLCISAFAQAGSITFTSDTTIGPANTTYENYAVTVRGCTVTIDGIHTFHSLTVENNGTVTHTAVNSSLTLDITDFVMVTADSRIIADGRGYGVASGPGAGVVSLSGYGNGGSHGGAGGRGASWQTATALSPNPPTLAQAEDATMAAQAAGRFA
jgi:hypothetical protein